MTENRVTENPDRMRFELEIEGRTAFAQYRRSGDRIILAHTEVPQELAGRGLGSELARGMFEVLASTNRKIVPECTFMADYVAKHPEVASLVER